jgi:DUF1016 N-terminal domain
VVIPRLATDLKNDLPEEKGFSERNIGYMIRFAREYGAPPILQQPVAKLVERRIEVRNKIHLQLLLTRQNLATQILELGKPFINGDKL